MALQVWLPLNGNLNNQGLNNTTFTGSTTFEPGKLGQAGVFGTAAKRAISSATVTLNSQVTIAFWIKIKTWVNWGRIFNLYNSDKTNTINCVSNTSTDKRIGTQVSKNGTNLTDSYNGSFDLNTWYHFAMVVNGTTKQHYINGSLVGTATLSDSMVTTNYTVMCGGTADSGTPVDMDINDFRVYDNALSPKEIEILSRGLVCHYPLNGGGRGQDNLLTYTVVNTANQALLATNYNSKWSELTIETIDGHACYKYPKAQSSTWFATGRWGGYLKANTTYTYSAWIYFTASSSTSFNFASLGHFQVYNSNSTASDKAHEDVVEARIYEPSTIPPNTWTKIRITFTTNSLANSRFQIYPRYAIGANVGDLYFRDMKLEETDHVTPWMPNSADTEYSTMGYNSTTEYDVSGYGYNGTKNGTLTYLTDTPRYNVSTKIGSTSSYIQIPNLTTTGFSNSYSFAWWGKVPSYQGYMMWGFSNGQRLNGIFNGNLWNTGDGSNNPLYVPGTTTQVTVPTTKVWHHWVMTGDGTTCKVYQDGVLWGQAKTYKSISGTTIYINGWDAGTSYTYGDYQMSDFRIYATALSAAQVAELYNTAVSVANNGALMGYELVEG